MVGISLCMIVLNEERVLDAKLDYGTKKWKVNDLPKLLVSLFGIIIGAEGETSSEAGTSRSPEAQ